MLRQTAILAAALIAMTADATAGDPAAEPGMTPWSSSGHARARLLAAGPPGGAGAGSAIELAGVDIRLDPGFITYWRNPGEAGLPPTFDTTSSVNIAAVTVDYPAPSRLEEGGTAANGYAGGVIFPLHVTLADPARPAVLALDLGYAVCGTLCLPAAAHLRLALPDAPVPDAAGRLAPALAAVPRAAVVGAPGPLAITHAAWVASSGDPAFAVTARAASDASLFIDAPPGWFLEPGAGVPSGQDGLTFPVAILQRPDGATLDGLAMQATLVDASGAIEVPLRVDGSPPKP